MKTIKPLFISCSLFFAGPAISATLSGTLAPTVVPLTNGGQANIAVSNTDPNLFTVPGDRITAINSLDGGLTNQEQTDSGGAILATVSKKPFTFIVETERGLNFSIRAVPRAGVGRTIQLVSELSGTPGPSRAWEESNPYESVLVALNRAVRQGSVPGDYQSVPVTSETLAVPAGLRATAERVWTGHHLKVVRYSLDNVSLSPRMVRESDFWQPGTRAVMLSTPAGPLTAGGRMQVWISTSDAGGSR
ncbi:type-F conjugative transfer system secretin TraK [Klebsiella pasteurii]|uniref:type-F conjugative transfer system secretin TraK n=1 Tax=Klebsiella pasteurii TaxID=2587529 RepID=UPI00237B7414|nr:type-F conjugative transfer system secretin TraK [Klebsiella pasteurii]MDD9665862.1 type-F conjugative transfer system secretin TraK [Klebsiella pasteurii]MDD9671233.1 type-F conjugative transfer system secretin TraK [Klebsiella pasteurii]MDD9687260.1 type-F conjugative transfer system secretin TraK [Klebsiella pasteurii]